MIFTTVGLDIVALINATKRPRFAGTLAVLGALVFVLPFISDQFGFFWKLPAPGAVATLELIAIVTQVAIFVVALRLKRGVAA